MMLSEMETRDNTVTIGQGQPIRGDAIWLGSLDECDVPRCVSVDDRSQALEWA